MEASFTPNIQLSEFAMKLRRYRQVSGLSQSEVCKQLGVSLERLGLLEFDRSTPTLLEKHRLKKLMK